MYLIYCYYSNSLLSQKASYSLVLNYLQRNDLTLKDVYIKKIGDV